MMRKLTIAALAGATIAGGALAGSAAAQPYDYYPRSYDPYYDRGYYTGPVYTREYYGDRSGAAAALSVLGALLGSGTSYYDRVPVDRFGPNPHGMRAPDGHRIRCHLRRTWDPYYGGRITRRVCR